MMLYLVNDDGYRARGINELYNNLTKYSITVIAPDIEKSACGHGITVHNSFSVEKIQEDRYAIAANPADCILWSFHKLGVPDLVISGINHGANLAQDIYYSGTMAAAREAAFKNVPSIAISLANDHSDSGHFESALGALEAILKSNILKILPPKTVTNINIPNVPLSEIQGVMATKLGWRDYQSGYLQDSKGLYQFNGSIKPITEKERTDTYAIAHNYVSISFLLLPESTCLLSQEIITAVDNITL